MGADGGRRAGSFPLCVAAVDRRHSAIDRLTDRLRRSRAGAARL